MPLASSSLNGQRAQPKVTVCCAFSLTLPTVGPQLDPIRIVHPDPKKTIYNLQGSGLRNIKTEILFLTNVVAELLKELTAFSETPV